MEVRHLISRWGRGSGDGTYLTGREFDVAVSIRAFIFYAVHGKGWHPLLCIGLGIVTWLRYPVRSIQLHDRLG
jgi:hypothetical protein